MLYPFLAFIYFASIFFITALVGTLLIRPSFLRKNKRPIRILYGVWFGTYILFILFFTGPNNLNEYPPHENSEYKLPWASGVSRFVAQGNRGFTSHRGLHMYAWDFLMPNGTEVLAARDGIVDEIVDSFDGIGFQSNYIHIKHSDGTYSGYAHIQKGRALIVKNESVKQGQPIALSGMVGQTILPHLHFYVLNKDKSKSVPISFNEVNTNPINAGRFYKSKNKKSKHP